MDKNYKNKDCIKEGNLLFAQKQLCKVKEELEQLQNRLIKEQTRLLIQEEDSIQMICTKIFSEWNHMGREISNLEIITEHLTANINIKK